jgi:hypothetical protein
MPPLCSSPLAPPRTTRPSGAHQHEPHMTRNAGLDDARSRSPPTLSVWPALPISVVTPRETPWATHVPSPPDAPPARPFSHVQRTEYVAQDDAAPQWVRAPEQQVSRALRCCGSDSAGGCGPCGHRGHPAARAPLPPLYQKDLVLESTHASTGGGGFWVQRGVHPTRMSPGAPRRQHTHASVIGCSLAPAHVLEAMPMARTYSQRPTSARTVPSVFHQHEPRKAYCPQ